ncbi:MAG: hypothetical protein O3A63_09300, partial [Proteobacteria bacterium]|nr:hypothetical protein [Pseudomonadota bacterium]
GYNGDLHLSWQEEIGGDVTVLRTSTLTSVGWSPPVEVSRGTGWFVNWADFPAVDRLAETNWIAHWRGRDHRGIHIEYSLSADGEHWSTPAVLSGTGVEQGFASAFRPIEGHSVDVPHVVWIDTDRGQSALLSMAVNGEDLKLAVASVCDCCQPSLVASQSGSLLAYRGRSENEIRDIYILRHSGNAWSTPLKVADDNWRIEGCPINGPVVATNSSLVAVAWYTEEGFQPRVQLALAGNDLQFDTPMTVNQEQPLGRTAVAFAGDDSVVVSYLRHADAGRSELCVRRLHDNQWSPVQVLASFSGQGPGFPQLASVNGAVVAAWSNQGRLFTEYVSFD